MNDQRFAARYGALIAPSSHPHWTHSMIRFKATPPVEKPAAASDAKPAKAASKAKAAASKPKEDLLDLDTDTQDDKD